MKISTSLQFTNCEVTSLVIPHVTWMILWQKQLSLTLPPSFVHIHTSVTLLYTSCHPATLLFSYHTATLLFSYLLLLNCPLVILLFSCIPVASSIPCFPSYSLPSSHQLAPQPVFYLPHHSVFFCCCCCCFVFFLISQLDTGKLHHLSLSWQRCTVCKLHYRLFT